MEANIDNVIINGTLKEPEQASTQDSSTNIDHDRLIEACVEQVIERLTSMQAR